MARKSTLSLNEKRLILSPHPTPSFRRQAYACGLRIQTSWFMNQPPTGQLCDLGHVTEMELCSR